MFSPNLLYGMVLLAFTSPNMPDTAEEHNFGWHPGHSITGAPNLLALTAEQVQPPAPEKKQSAPEKVDTKNAQGEQEEKPSQQTDKKKPPKDFQPTEKIDADKAVDFPADI